MMLSFMYSMSGLLIKDPDFKRVFYCEILPDLKKRGAAVVVISHDDRYFECADELVMMEY